MANNHLPPCTVTTTEWLQWWAFTPVKGHPLQDFVPEMGVGICPRVGLYPKLNGTSTAGKMRTVVYVNESKASRVSTVHQRTGKGYISASVNADSVRLCVAPEATQHTGAYSQCCATAVYGQCHVHCGIIDGKTHSYTLEDR